jgi:hypothetical protein
MFKKGLESEILAAGRLETSTRLSGKTVKGVGMAPQEHLTKAPIHTH